MKKRIFFNIFILLIIISCSNMSKAKSIYERLPTIDECLLDINLAKSAIKKLDEIIELAPNWWKPYLTELSIYQNWNLKSGTHERDLLASAQVYERWMKSNEMGISRNVAYADLLDNLNRKEESIKILNVAWKEFNKIQNRELKTETEKNDFLFGMIAGVKLGYITKSNLVDYSNLNEYSSDFTPFLETYLSDD